MSQTSPGVTIARWRKHGKDRLYVAHTDGIKVGYWDLVSDEPHPERPELAAMLESAYAEWTLGRRALGRPTLDSVAMCS